MLTLDELLPLQCWSTESTVSFCFPSKPWVLSTGCMFLSSLPTSMETSNWLFSARSAAGSSSGGGDAGTGLLGSLSSGELTSSC